MVSWDSALIDRIRADKVKEQSEDRDNLNMCLFLVGILSLNL